jgi:hypothetical protein
VFVWMGAARRCVGRRATPKTQATYRPAPSVGTTPKVPRGSSSRGVSDATWICCGRPGTEDFCNAIHRESDGSDQPERQT